MLNNLYECECDYLNRAKLPFRNQFEQRVTTDIVNKYSPSDYSILTYVTQNPGGLLADARIINELIKHGYKHLQIICIEPLYQKNISILQACLNFNTWCTQQKNCHITTHWYLSTKEYVADCVLNEQLKGHVYICIDPDNRRVRPNFSSLSFRKRFQQWYALVMHTTNSFYYLYFETVNSKPYRHILQGTCNEIDNKFFMQLHHWYGKHNLDEHYARYYFWKNQPTYPLGNQTYMIQYGKRVVKHEKLWQLMQN